MEPNTFFLYEYRSRLDQRLKPEAWTMQSALLSMGRSMREEQSLRALALATQKKNFANALFELRQIWHAMVYCQLRDELRKSSLKKCRVGKKIYLYQSSKRQRKQREQVNMKINKAIKRNTR